MVGWRIMPAQKLGRAAEARASPVAQRLASPTLGNRGASVWPVAPVTARCERTRRARGAAVGPPPPANGRACGAARGVLRTERGEAERPRNSRPAPAAADRWNGARRRWPRGRHVARGRGGCGASWLLGAMAAAGCAEVCAWRSALVLAGP